MKESLSFKISRYPRYLKETWILLFFSLSITLYSQVTDNSNIAGPGTPFLGWEASVGDDLEITHNQPTRPIIFSTDNIERARIAANGRTRFGVQTGGLPGFSTQWRSYVYDPVRANNVGHSGIIANQTQQGQIFGLEVISDNADNIAGVTARARSNDQTIENIGLFAKAENAFGSGSASYGVFGLASFTSPNDWAGYFDGPVVYTGSYSISDQTMKTSIQEVDNPGTILEALRPVKFNFIEGHEMNLPQGLQYGFIAQEFQEVLPNCVKESVIYTDTSMETEVNYDNTLLSITTQEVIPLLIKGGQGQQLEISSMSDEINQLNSQLSALENSINLLISE